MKFEELEKGLSVVYIPTHLRSQIISIDDIESILGYLGVQSGVVSSYNDKFVFVDYDNAGWGRATYLEDLEILDK